VRTAPMHAKRAFMSARAVYAATDGQGAAYGQCGGTTFVGRSGRGEAQPTVW
jgi:hypothetical protein